ncbi:MAG: HD domain-containing protein, partial [Bryobacteraceae bacterium]
MKSPYVADLQANQVATTVLLVTHKDIRQKRTGESYLSLTLADRTGELDSKMWDNAAEVMETFERDDFVRVKGVLQVFQNRPQFTIHKLQRVDASEQDLADYLPASKRDPAEMWAELQSRIGSIANPHLKALLDSIFSDQAIASAYRKAPAAKQIHHAWLGGLLEHVLSLAALADLTAAHYPVVDRDLLLTGVVLHDIGKIYELGYERSFSYTVEGQLLGHIVIGAQLADEHIRRLPDFPPKLRLLVQHLILSHHGEMAFGSPKVPLFPEAMLLHHLDNMDSKMEAMRSLVANDKNVAGVWTAFNSALDRSVLKKETWLKSSPASS